MSLSPTSTHQQQQSGDIHKKPASQVIRRINDQKINKPTKQQKEFAIINFMSKLTTTTNVTTTKVYSTVQPVKFRVNDLLTPTHMPSNRSLKAQKLN